MPRSPLRAAIISAVAPRSSVTLTGAPSREQLPDERVVALGRGLQQPATEHLGLLEQRRHVGMSARRARADAR